MPGWAELSPTLLGRASLALLCVCLLAGCRTAVEQAVRPVYQPAALEPGVTVVRDIAYRTGADAHLEKHRLDLYLPNAPFDPQERTIPVLVFVHGGSLEKGDKDLEVVGLDFYRNIGRFYSARGVAVGIVNYRLQPEVTWHQQVEDVAAAAGWVRTHLTNRFPRTRSAGDNPPQFLEPRLYLAGHSAGAWLVSRVALDQDVRRRYGLELGSVAGVISISGSGFEMTDRRTWELYRKENWWAQRFAVPEPADWHEEASVVPLVANCRCGDQVDPSVEQMRFLLLFSNHELPALARQNRLLANALEEKGLEHRLVAVSSGSHRRTVMAMSHPEKIVSREVLSFVATDELHLPPIQQDRVVEQLTSRD